MIKDACPRHEPPVEVVVCLLLAEPKLPHPPPPKGGRGPVVRFASNYLSSLGSACGAHRGQRRRL